MPVLIRALISQGAIGETKGAELEPKAIPTPTRGKSPGVILIHV
jgi:hypothetical protein